MIPFIKKYHIQERKSAVGSEILRDICDRAWHAGCFLGGPVWSAPWKRTERSRGRQRERLRCNAGTINSPLLSHRDTGTRTASQICPALGRHIPGSSPPNKKRHVLRQRSTLQVRLILEGPRGTDSLLTAFPAIVPKNLSLKEHLTSASQSK